jgi:hypothetical protein
MIEYMNDEAAPHATANEVVTAEVKVTQGRGEEACPDTGRADTPRAHEGHADTGRACGKDTACGETKKLSPDAEKLAEELYKNLSMGCDAYMDMLARVEDNRIKTDVTAAMCYYEKTIGKVKEMLLAGGAEPEERGKMARMASRAGIAMNVALDNTNSHIAEMLIEGATMSITTAGKLANHAEGKPDCAELVRLCRDWEKFEQNHIEALKRYL